MIVRSIRLANIKSYGKGADGRGVTVTFQPGVNRIAGANGHGKSTLIECLGYALFLTEPIFEENFKVDTYFLKRGSKAGEIDVTFSIGNDTYRVERGLGAGNKRKTKVVLTADESICAEGDREVSEFLCRVLQMPAPSRLTELFQKLVGVKQGRLAWPFDSKPGEAKQFFEPLLEVEVFRRCFEDLKPATDRFEAERREHEKVLASVLVRIQERADAPERLSAAEQTLAEQKATVETAVAAGEAALQEKLKQESLERAVNAARVAKDTAGTAVQTAEAFCAEARTRVTESEQAAVVVDANVPAHRCYEAAEQALSDLEEKRRARDTLRTSRNEADTSRTSRVSGAKAARDQATLLSQQKSEKETQRAVVDAEIGQLGGRLDSRRDVLEAKQRAAAEADTDRIAVAAWVARLPDLAGRLASRTNAITEASTELSAWDPAGLEKAQSDETTASELHSRIKERLATVRERKAGLSSQLEQIAGGTCPFLKETCRQFEPEKIRSDLDALESGVTSLEVEVREAEEAKLASGETLKLLARAAAGLVRIREQLAANIAAFRGEYASAVTEDAAASVSRLRAWQDAIGECPTMHPLPAGDLAPETVQALRGSVDAFVAGVEVWWAAARNCIQKRADEVAEEQAERTRQETRLCGLEDQRAVLDAEIAGLATQVQSKEQETIGLEQETAAFTAAVQRLDDQLQPLSGLDGEIDAQKALRDENRDGHERYLASRSAADELITRREQVQKRVEAQAQAAQVFEVSAASLLAAEAAFDPLALAVARQRYEELLSAGASARTTLGYIESEIAELRKRVEQWAADCLERDRIAHEIARRTAMLELTDLARKTLRDAAPAVAQHLCDRIAKRAQVVFNQINPEPIELEWRAERYGLNIAPADRRFAMLSGGEQTKLALAMTLAMVAEFSNLHFCIFDEPTYGVDAGSRSKLADAVLDAQRVAGLEQLLLVSHDDAFEGKIEHAIFLSKSAAEGSTVLER